MDNNAVGHLLRITGMAHKRTGIALAVLLPVLCSGCGGQEAAGESRPVRMCGQVFTGGGISLAQYDASQEDVTVSLPDVRNEVRVVFSHSCDQGVNVDIVPPTAATVTIAIRTKDRKTAAVVVRVQAANFTIVGRNGQRVHTVTVALPAASPSSLPAIAPMKPESPTG